MTKFHTEELCKEEREKEFIVVYGSRDLESTTAGKAWQSSKSKRLGGAKATDLQGKPQ